MNSLALAGHLGVHLEPADDLPGRRCCLRWCRSWQHYLALSTVARVRRDVARDDARRADRGRLRRLARERGRGVRRRCRERGKGEQLDRCGSATARAAGAAGAWRAISRRALCMRIMRSYRAAPATTWSDAHALRWPIDASTSSSSTSTEAAGCVTIPDWSDCGRSGWRRPCGAARQRPRLPGEILIDDCIMRDARPQHAERLAERPARAGEPVMRSRRRAGGDHRASTASAARAATSATLAADLAQPAAAL